MVNETIKVAPEVEVLMPSVPNYLRRPSASGAHEVVLDVCELSEAELRKVGARWVEALVRHAAERRDLRESGRRRGHGG